MAASLLMSPSRPFLAVSYLRVPVAAVFGRSFVPSASSLPTSLPVSPLRPSLAALVSRRCRPRSLPPHVSVAAVYGRLRVPPLPSLPTSLPVSPLRPFLAALVSRRFRPWPLFCPCRGHRWPPSISPHFAPPTNQFPPFCPLIVIFCLHSIPSFKEKPYLCIL